MFRACFLLVSLLLASATTAQTNPVERTQEAQQELEQAAVTLQDARRSNDRVMALTKALRAYESGLLSLRSGVQTSDLRGQEIKALFVEKQRKLTKLLAILQSMGRDPVPTVLLHPSGPTNTIRAAMMTEAVAEQIASETEALKDQLSQLAEIDALSETVAETLDAALSNAQEARSELTDAISDRIALPRSFTADPVRMRNLIRSSDTLEGFLTQLAGIDISPSDAQPDFAELRGQLISPVSGRVHTEFNMPDSAGISRPGILMTAPAKAIVITPADATVRYAGPLLDYGLTVVVEPASGFLLILAGMDQLFAEAGQVLASGTPIGIMGGTVPAADGFLSFQPNDSSGNREETLYIEIRNGDTPMDPKVWFALKKE